MCLHCTIDCHCLMALRVHVQVNNCCVLVLESDLVFYFYHTVQYWIVGSWLKPFLVNEASKPLVDKLHCHYSIMIDIMLVTINVVRQTSNRGMHI